ERRPPDAFAAGLGEADLRVEEPAEVDDPEDHEQQQGQHEGMPDGCGPLVASRLRTPVSRVRGAGVRLASHHSAAGIWLNRATTACPNTVTDVAMATAMREATSAYSTAVAPSSCR